MRVLLLLAALAGCCGFAGGTAHAFQVDIGAETIVMEGRYDKPALFPHRRHQEWCGCAACHHAKDRTMTVGRCGACHDENLKNPKLDSVREAAHALCKECHSRERERGRPAPRAGCNVCHPQPDAPPQ